jgi:hypothetical protein
MPLPWGPSRLWRRPAWPTRSARRAGWRNSSAGLRGSVAGRARRRVWRWPLLGVWCGSPVWVRHHAGPLGLRSLAVTPVQPVEILVAPRRHVSKGTWGQGRDFQLLGVASTSMPQSPQILAGIFLRFLPRQQTERLPRCPFAPRRLHRVPRPRCASPTSPPSKANASDDVGV